MLIVREPINTSVVQELALQRFGDMVKAVVDIEQEIMALGGDLHADEEKVLIDQGSMQENLWGINIYPDLPRSEWIEFDSMINIRPRQDNRSRSVEDKTIQEKIVTIVNRLII
ncbi:MAG: hypothetical protein HYV32_05015 [Candidatus Kerfeldbacteria bacterium]|nr:hypothetical protein [Candidatus Kerfeldbacteria bacterium]